MIEHLLRKRRNSNKWLNLTSKDKKKKIKRGNINKWLNLTSKAKKKKMIKIVVLDIPCIIELTCGACELVAFFHFFSSFPLEFLDSFL